MKLTKKSNHVVDHTENQIIDSSSIEKIGTARKAAGEAMSRRQFLRSSSLMAGGRCISDDFHSRYDEKSRSSRDY